MKNSLVEKVLQLETNDYQNRKGNYPSSNVPDSIETGEYNNKIHVNCLFKNTSEEVAKRWLENKLMNLGVNISKINIITCQEGDYNNDWVASYVNINIENLK